MIILRLQLSVIMWFFKAAIKWILFDNQFRPVSVGTDLVSSAGDIIKPHNIPNITMAESGYLYIYCSNESALDVYFDNLQVTDVRGPILEETHYYPYGLAMAGISDHAWNKLPNLYHYQGDEIQNGEFSDGTGLEEYDFEARYYEYQEDARTFLGTSDPNVATTVSKNGKIVRMLNFQTREFISVNQVTKQIITYFKLDPSYDLTNYWLEQIAK